MGIGQNRRERMKEPIAKVMLFTRERSGDNQSITEGHVTGSGDGQRQMRSGNESQWIGKEG